MKNRAAVIRHPIGIGASFEEQANESGVTMTKGILQGGLAVLVFLD